MAAAGTGVPDWPGCVAVVLAGGSSRRLGGPDKLAELVGGTPLLQLVVDAVPGAVPVVVVGPTRALTRARGAALVHVREDPPGTGPAAAAAAGLAGASGPGGAPPLVVLLAGDAPRGPHAVPALLAALAAAPAAVAAVARDAGGHRQPLLAVHRRDALAARTAGDDLAGRSAGWLLGGRAVGPDPAVGAGRVVEVDVDDALLADVDTPDDLARERGLTRPVPPAGAGEP